MRPLARACAALLLLVSTPALLAAVTAAEPADVVQRPASQAPPATAQAPPSDAAPASLYHRLGGYDAIAAVTDDFVGRLLADPRLARFFGGLSADSGKRLRQHLVDQLCAATGGPCLYVGRDMKTSHAGLGITEADWNAAVEDLVATLDRFAVPDRERQELFAILATLEPDIVEAE